MDPQPAPLKFPAPVIALAGRKRTGKDTIAKYLIEDFGYTRLAFADAVRDMCEAINPIIDAHMITQALGEEGVSFAAETTRLNDYLEMIGGWDKAKDQHREVRRIMQVVGTEAVRDIIGPNTWVEIVERQVDALKKPVVITDLRFPNEESWVRERKGWVWKVRRPQAETSGDAHSSETSVDLIEANAVIMNSGTLDDLRLRVHDEMARLGVWGVVN